ncbi:MAG: CHAD domain-containing protein [Phycisphaerales bacterium]
MAERGAEDSARDDRPTGDLARAARESVRDTLRRAAKSLRRAGKSGDAESIHRMRVATRRAQAALIAFGDLIKDGEALERVGGDLDRMRRSGSRARSCDVDLRALGDRLRACDDCEMAAAIGFVMSRLSGERARGRERVGRLGKRFDSDGYRRAAKRIVRSIDAGGAGERLTEWAMKRVGGALEEVWARGNDGALDSERLHELRIALKRLRYQAELFESFVAWSGWRGMIEACAACQERLGHANDATELAARVRGIAEELDASESGWGVSLRVGLDRLADGLEREGRERGEAAQSWWMGEGKRSVDRLIGNGSTGGSNGPMMDLDAAMDAALTDARRSLEDRGTGG